MYGKSLASLIVVSSLSLAAPLHAQILGGGGHVGGAVGGSLSGGASGSLQRPGDPIGTASGRVDDSTDKAHEKTDAAANRSRDTADKAGDKDTADLFTGVSRGVDKDLWFVESHLQKGR